MAAPWAHAQPPHLHLRLQHRHTYPAFIRALTGAIALFVAGRGQGRFWDRRPFSRIVIGRRGFLTLRNYVQINLLEEIGFSRSEARLRVSRSKPPKPAG